MGEPSPSSSATEACTVGAEAFDESGSLPESSVTTPLESTVKARSRKVGQVMGSGEPDAALRASDSGVSGAGGMVDCGVGVASRCPALARGRFANEEPSTSSSSSSRARLECRTKAVEQADEEERTRPTANACDGRTCRAETLTRFGVTDPALAFLLGGAKWSCNSSPQSSVRLVPLDGVDAQASCADLGAEKGFGARLCAVAVFLRVYLRRGLQRGQSLQYSSTAPAPRQDATLQGQLCA